MQVSYRLFLHHTTASFRGQTGNIGRVCCAVHKFLRRGRGVGHHWGYVVALSCINLRKPKALNMKHRSHPLV